MENKYYILVTSEKNGITIMDFYTPSIAQAVKRLHDLNLYGDMAEVRAFRVINGDLERDSCGDAILYKSWRTKGKSCLYQQLSII